jgi:hypothetical protein
MMHASFSISLVIDIYICSGLLINKSRFISMPDL